MYIRERHIYTFQDFCKSLMSAFQNSPSVTVIPVYSIMNYKAYYDQFIDTHLVDKYSKLEFTQLYFKVQPLREVDALNNHHNILVRTNYKKFGQEYTVLLRHNEFIDGNADIMPFTPIVLKSDWMPEKAQDADCPFTQPCPFNCFCKERAPGISFLSTIPHGIPKPLAFDNGSHTNLIKFLDKVNDYFGKRNESAVVNYWQTFYAQILPESDNVNEYLERKFDMDQPLAEYLYGTRSFSQILIEEDDINNVNFVDSTTGFSAHRIRASLFDIDMMDHIVQDKQTIPWRGHRVTAKNWEFNKDSLLSRIVLTRGTGVNRRSQEGTVVAWCGADANDGPLFQIVFDDRTAPTTLTSIQYHHCRAAYLEKHPDEQTLILEAQQRRTNETRARVERSGRTGRGRGRTQQQLQILQPAAAAVDIQSASFSSSTSTSSSSSNVQISSYTNSSSSHIQQQQQRFQVRGGRTQLRQQQQLPLHTSSRNATATSSSSHSSSNNSTTTAIAALSTTILSHTSSNSTAVAEAFASHINSPLPASSASTTSQSHHGMDDSALSSLISLNQAVTIHHPAYNNTAPIHVAVVSSPSSAALSQVQQQKQLTREELIQNSSSVSAVVRPPLSIPLHNTDVQLLQDVSERRSNTAILPLTAATNNNKRPKRKIFLEDELCFCGCDKEYSTTCMTNCRGGSNCLNRVNRSCVPRTWKCLNCCGRDEV